MAFSWLINGGYYLLTNWDDPPSRPKVLHSKKIQKESFEVGDETLHLIEDNFTVRTRKKLHAKSSSRRICT